MRTLSVLYVLGVSALGFGLALQAEHPWAIGVKQVAEAAPPAIGAAARATDRHVIRPAWSWTAKTASGVWHDIHDWLWPKPRAPKVAVAKPPVKKLPSPASGPQPASGPSPALRPLASAAPKLELATPEADLPLEPAPDAAPPAPGEIARVQTHLKESLTTELFSNFELFLYISKADHGPWRQRMFVFAKEAGGTLNLKYSFPVSTGRETPMPSPDGTAMWHTSTPTGYFQLDPERVWRRYTSQQWGHKMPYAMFFSWEYDGRQTGVAIHAADGDDAKLLGARASAGCVRLHPQNAHLLFKLVKQNYRGLAPLFAYDKRTETMSKEGLLMHDKAGNLEFAQGYKVLVLIENKGGDDLIAALF